MKNKTTVGSVIAEGIKRAYAPLYDANEHAHELPPEELKGLVAQVSGAEDLLIKVIVGTLNSLVKCAVFTSSKPKEEGPEDQTSEAAQGQKNRKPNGGEQESTPPPLFKPDFRFNIEIHLPSNGTEETYLAIFDALRKSLG